MRGKSCLAMLAAIALGCSGSESTSPTPTPPGGGGGGQTPVVPVATVEIANAPAELETGKSRSLSAVTKSATGATLTGRDVRWTSSSDAILSVNAGGTIQAQSPGSATVTATSEGVAATATVKVNTRNGFMTAIIEEIRVQHDLPALAGMIVTRQNGMFGAAVSGKRRVSQATPVTLNDMWHIGSNLKAITAHVAGIAVTEGKISWTTTLQQAYPELAGSMRPEYRTVTLRMLLGHIGGMMANINTNQVPAGTLTAQRANIAMQATAAVPVGGGVGTYTYSNVGFIIAANMVERAAGMSWEEFMQQKLLTPLGATAFGWGPTPAASNPIGHQRNGTSAWTEWPNSDNPPFASSAGRSHWSLDSYAKALQDIMKADQGESALVTQAVARVNTTSQSSQNYGSGWLIANSAGWAQGRGVEHDGSNNLNYARMQVALDRGVAVVGITNSHDIGSQRSYNAMIALTQRLWAYYAAHGT